MRSIGLLVGVAVVGAAVFALESAFGGAGWLTSPLPLLFCLPLIWSRRNRDAALVLGVIGVELVCAHSAWHTVGEVASALLYLLVWLNAVPVAMLCSARIRRAGAIAMAIGFVAIAPLQITYAVEWAVIHHEAERMKAWANGVEARTGTFPPRAEYTFQFDWTAAHIRYDPARYADRVGGQDSEIYLSYWVSTTSTSHSATSTGWFYYPD